MHHLRKEYLDSNFEGSYTRYLEYKLCNFQVPFRFEEVLKYVCFVFEVTYEEITTKDQFKKVTQPRQVLQYLCDKYTLLSPQQIATRTGRARSCVVNSWEVVLQDMRTNKKLEGAVLQIEKLLRNERQ